VSYHLPGDFVRKGLSCEGLERAATRREDHNTLRDCRVAENPDPAHTSYKCSSHCHLEVEVEERSLARRALSGMLSGDWLLGSVAADVARGGWALSDCSCFGMGCRVEQSERIKKNEMQAR
jgi:hypothetical protein